MLSINKISNINFKKGLTFLMILNPKYESMSIPFITKIRNTNCIANLVITLEYMYSKMLVIFPNIDARVS